MFIAIVLLVANTFYIYVSRPRIKTSDILARASTGLALASLELRYHAQDVQAREAEAEKRRLAEAEHNQYKLQVAKDVLQQLRWKAPGDRAEKTKLSQITHQRLSDNRALPLQPPVAPAAHKPPLANGHDAVAEPSQTVAQKSPVPSSAVLN